MTTGNTGEKKTYKQIGLAFEIVSSLDSKKYINSGVRESAIKDPKECFHKTAIISFLIEKLHDDVLIQHWLLLSGHKGRDDQWYKMMTQRQQCPPPQKNLMSEKTYMINDKRQSDKNKDPVSKLWLHESDNTQFYL